MFVRSHAYTAAALFLLVAAMDSTSHVSTQGDSRWVIPQALSLLDRHTFALDEYASRFPQENYYFIECVSADHVRTYPFYQPVCPGGHFYYLSPPALAMLAAPFVAALEAAVHVVGLKGGSGVVGAFLRGDFVESSKMVEIIIASLFVAAATAVLYLALQQIVTLPEAVILALMFAFATSAWSTASRALASHAPTLLLNSVLLYLLFRSFDRPGLAWALVPVAVLSFYVRPTNIISLAVVAFYVFVHVRRRMVLAALASVPIVATFLAISLSIYGTVLPPYFYADRTSHTILSWHPRVLEALAGNLVSPGRGMFVYCPFLLLLFWPAAWRTDLGDRFRTLRPYLLAIVILQWVVLSFHYYWWAGFSYGPRYLCDIVPYLIVLMAPVVRCVFQEHPRIRVVLAVLVALAVFIHARGAYSAAVHQWNATPVDIDSQPSRVWDWRDPPFLRDL